MAKKVMQDMKSRGITQISRGDINIKKELKLTLPKKDLILEVEKDTKPKDHLLQRDFRDKIYSTPQIKKSGIFIRKPIIILLIISIIISGIYFISNKFENTKINIIEKKQSLNLNTEQFIASIDIKAPINFELMIIPNTELKDIILKDSQNVSIKAQGEIILYNEYSTKPQNLLIRTFLSDSSGKAYQTNKAVTIPGFKTDKSKVIPGQVVVGITSFLSGEAYNGAPSNFFINLFKGTAKAKKIYGKLKSALSGGAEGVVYTLTPQDLGSLNAYTLSTFKSNLLKKINAQVPPGYILYPDALKFVYKVEEEILSPTPNAKVKINGTMSSIILKEKDLSNAIVKKLLPGVLPKELNGIQIENLSSLSFSFLNQDQLISKDVKSITFNITGNVKLIWRQNVEMLKNSLIRVDKSTLLSIFKTDPGISSVSVKIFPPWNKYLPSDSSKINIHIE